MGLSQFLAMANDTSRGPSGSDLSTCLSGAARASPVLRPENEVHGGSGKAVVLKIAEPKSCFESLAEKEDCYTARKYQAPLADLIFLQLPRSTQRCPKCRNTDAVHFQSQQRTNETGMVSLVLFASLPH